MLGGIGVALATGPLGCFVVWRRMAYFGSALSHAALLGVALGLLAGIGPTLGVVLTALAMALALAGLGRQSALADDTLLGILAHSSLALGIVLVVAFLQGMRVDLMGYLFGDVLAISNRDLVAIAVTLFASLGLLAWIWRPLLALTVDAELAAVEGVRVGPIKLTFMLTIALVIAIGIKVVGALLIVSLLVVPAAAARRMARTPEQMAIGAAAIGSLSVVLGLLLSLAIDSPTGPSIVVVATAIFLLIFLAVPRPAGAG